MLVPAWNVTLHVQDVLLTGGGDGRVKFWDLGNGGAAVGNRYDVGGDSFIHAFKVGCYRPLLCKKMTKGVSCEILFRNFMFASCV